MNVAELITFHHFCCNLWIIYLLEVFFLYYYLVLGSRLGMIGTLNAQIIEYFIDFEGE